MVDATCVYPSINGQTKCAIYKKQSIIHLLKVRKFLHILYEMFIIISSCVEGLVARLPIDRPIETLH